MRLRLLTGARVLKKYAELIRIEHTLFSLPFAYSGAFLVRPPTPREALLIFTALFGLRTFSLTVNNIIDAEIDRKNPRTASRPIPSGKVSKREAWVIAIVGLVIYEISSYLLNKWAFLLSPIFPIMAFIYPYLKRFTPITHFWLGTILGGAAFGGAVAVLGNCESLYEVLTHIPWLYVIALAAWVSGFDMLYAILDVEFDKREGLHSFPADFGIEKTLKVSLLLHAITSICVVYTAPSALSALGALLLGRLHGIAYIDPIKAGKLSLNENIKIGLLLGLAPIVYKTIGL